jgi:hypothetical protein
MPTTSCLLAERLGDLDADSAGSSDNDNFMRHTILPGEYACRDLKPVDRHIPNRASEINAVAASPTAVRSSRLFGSR